MQNEKQWENTGKNSKLIDNIINLQISHLNAPIKRQRLAKWILNQDPVIWNLDKVTSNIIT